MINQRGIGMKKLRGIIQFGLTFILLNGLLLFVGWNGWEWLKNSFGFCYLFVYWFIYGIVAYSFLLGRLSKYLSFLRTVGNIWFGFFQYAVLLLPIADIIILLLKWGTGHVSTTAILIAGLAIIFSIALLFGIGIYNAYSPVIRKYEITVPKKNSKLSTLRIAMASDMHFGRLSGVAHLENLIKNIQGIQPDIILLPGDIIDDELEPFIQKNMGEMMGELTASLGVYGVLGNHEYYGRQIPQFIQQMNQIHIKILMDEVLTIDESFHLLGRKDKTDKDRKSFEELLTEIDRSLPIIAMDHQPSEIKQARENGVDVLFSGHTHRGQMAPNHLITRKMFELDWGYLHKDQLHAFVSSGYGFWGPPMRLASRSEILQIDICFT